MTHLWIEGFERYLSYDSFTETHLIQAQILGSKSLDLSQNPLDGQRAPHVDAFLVLLGRILPNLRDFNLSYIKTAHGVNSNIIMHFAAHCLHFIRLSWKGADGENDFHGHRYENMTGLTELYMDNAYILHKQKLFLMRDGKRTKAPCPFIGLCPAKLEHVSIKGVIIKDHGVGSERQPLSEEANIQLVRNQASLRLLRSGMTEQNVAMLKQERPEIPFVS